MDDADKMPTPCECLHEEARDDLRDRERAAVEGQRRLAVKFGKRTGGKGK